MRATDDEETNIPRWLDWARELAAMAQTGLTYARDPYDVARYQRLQAIAAEMIASNSPADYRRVHDLITGETGHPTPKLDVRAAVFQDENVLLVRERADGGWTLPGGWADPGESPREAAERETQEESGYLVRANRLLAVYDRNKHPHPPLIYHAYKLFFACQIVGGEARESSETTGVGFFPVTALPGLSLARVTPAQIERLYAINQDGLAADFD